MDRIVSRDFACFADPTAAFWSARVLGRRNERPPNAPEMAQGTYRIPSQNRQKNRKISVDTTIETVTIAISTSNPIGDKDRVLCCRAVRWIEASRKGYKAFFLTTASGVCLREADYMASR
jgi:hypothetical protein